MVPDNRKLTVVQMLPELEGGGVERGTLDLGRFMAKKGHRSIVISGGGRLVDQLQEEGSEHIKMEVGKKSPATFKYVLPLRRLMLEEEVDVLHLRSRVPAWAGYLAWKSLPKNNRPLLVTTFHGFYSVNRYSAIMTKGQAVIAVSEVIKKHILESYGVSENVTLIHRGVDEESFRPDAVEPERLQHLLDDWKIPKEGPVIMLPGRFTRLKGQHLFIESLAQLKTRNFLAVLVGDADENPGYSAELKELIRKNRLEDNIRFAGHCSDMAAAYLVADIVVSATTGTPESFGRVAVEAMAMGKPVLATAHGGSLEIIEDGKTGWLVPPSDAEKMAATVELALSQAAKWPELGKNGRQRVKENFTVTKMCTRTLDLYNQLLA